MWAEGYKMSTGYYIICFKVVNFCTHMQYAFLYNSFVLTAITFLRITGVSMLSN